MILGFRLLLLCSIIALASCATTQSHETQTLTKSLSHALINPVKRMTANPATYSPMGHLTTALKSHDGIQTKEYSDHITIYLTKPLIFEPNTKTLSKASSQTIKPIAHDLARHRFEFVELIVNPENHTLSKSQRQSVLAQVNGIKRLFIDHGVAPSHIRTSAAHVKLGRNLKPSHHANIAINVYAPHSGHGLTL